MQSGRGTLDDAHQLASLCHLAGDEACLRRAESLVVRLGGGR
ncbi:MAG TPA: hypothetical protein VFS00_18780 [Polyangiaceae bacterium]|nr:hypothetical protein [Polyangiaceae bacterium]